MATDGPATMGRMKSYTGKATGIKVNDTGAWQAIITTLDTSVATVTVHFDQSLVADVERYQTKYGVFTVDANRLVSVKPE